MTLYLIYLFRKTENLKQYIYINLKQKEKKINLYIFFSFIIILCYLFILILTYYLRNLSNHKILKLQRLLVITIYNTIMK